MENSEKPEISPDKLEEWIESVEEGNYSFLDERPDLFTHEAPERKGDEGLGNFAALLAVYREDGELDVDDEMVEKLDQLQRENGAGKQRYRNITDRLQQNLEKQNTGGHQRLREMINAYRENINDSLPEDNETIFKDYTSKPGPSNQTKGGDNTMTLADKVESLELAQEDHYEAAGRIVDAVNQYEDVAEAATAAAEELAETYGLQGEAAESAVNSLTEYLMDHRDHMDNTALRLLEGADEIRDTLEGIEEPDYDEMLDALHVAAIIERKTEEEYDFDF
ncbi:MAG: hypothetical protein ABEJ93_01620 [Candidatus Nanohalobium sp.]